MRRTTLFAALPMFALATAAPLRADPYTLGTLSNFAIYGFGTGFTEQLGPGPITINGNVGVGPDGIAVLIGTGVVINGHMYYSDPPVDGINFTASNGIKSIIGTACSNAGGLTPCFSLAEQNALATQAKLDEIALYAAVAGHAPTTSVTNINSSTSFTATAEGTFVNVGGNIRLLAGDQLTINGGADDFIIFNVLGGMIGASGGSIALAGGITSDHVLFNFLCNVPQDDVCADDLGSGASIGFHSGFVGFGNILAPGRDINLTPGGSWNGRFFSSGEATIKLFSEPQLNAPEPTSTVPEPGSMLLLGSGLAGLAGVRGIFFRRRRTRATVA